MNFSRKKIILAIAVVACAAAAVFYIIPSSSGDTPPASLEHAEKKEGTRAVELSDAEIAAAGIELAIAAEGEIRESLRLNGILQPNQENLVQVTPRFPGIAREIYKRIGDRIGKGDLLARIESNTSLTTYDLRAPITGTVIDRQMSLGEYVSEQKPAFIIADLSSVWADFSVYRHDLGRIQIGNDILIDAEDGGSPITARISYISPVGNSETQSALARVILSNENGRLRPGLFVSGRLFLVAKPAPVTVRLSALQTVNNQTVVFVREGDKFAVREVEAGSRDTESVEIKSGLVSGDAYAAKNSFVIKAELAKGEGGHEH